MITLNPSGASGFTASKCRIHEGFGYSATFPLPFMQPELIKTLSALPHDIKLASVMVKEGRVLHVLPVKIHETTQGKAYTITVTGALSTRMGNFFSTGCELEYFQQKDLNHFFATLGIASPSSKPDGVVGVSYPPRQRTEGGVVVVVGMCVVELKDTAAAPLEQLGQLYASGSNFVLAQYKLGVPHDRCGVPLIASNGHLYQFGFVTLLYPSWPVLHTVSEVLDSTSQEHVEIIASYLAKIKSFCLALHRDMGSALTESAVMKSLSVAIDENRYHLKSMSKVFLAKSNYLSTTLRLWEVYDALDGIEEAVKPVALLTGKLEESNYLVNDSIVFPKLQGYRMGVPLTEDHFQVYLSAVKRTFKKFHAAGVVHVDAYTSNIMWRINEEGAFDIRVVDWDAASFIGEEMEVNIWNEMRRETFTCYSWAPPTNKACFEIDAWHIFILSHLNETERRTLHESGESVLKVNVCYKNAIERIRSGLDDVSATFAEWVKGKWNDESL